MYLLRNSKKATREEDPQPFIIVSRCIIVASFLFLPHGFSNTKQSHFDFVCGSALCHARRQANHPSHTTRRIATNEKTCRRSEQPTTWNVRRESFYKRRLTDLDFRTPSVYFESLAGGHVDDVSGQEGTMQDLLWYVFCSGLTRTMRHISIIIIVIACFDTVMDGCWLHG